MKYKRVWWPLFLFAFGVFSFCAARFGIDAFHFYTFSHPVEATINHWGVEEVDREFEVYALYSFAWKGKTYKGKYPFSTKFEGRYQAQYHLEKIQKDKSILYFDGKNPHFVSLERLFPFKRMIYAFLSLGVTVYFFVFRWYFKNRLF